MPEMRLVPRDGTRVLFYFKDEGVMPGGRHLPEGWSIGARCENDAVWQFENWYYQGRTPAYWWPLERPKRRNGALVRVVIWVKARYLSRLWRIGLIKHVTAFRWEMDWTILD